jgi:arsenate reductase
MDNGVEPEIIEYLKYPIDEDLLEDLMNKLSVSDVREIMRIKEPEYKALGLNENTISQQALKSALLATPKLLERPIVFTSENACIGRPPENVLELL